MSEHVIVLMDANARAGKRGNGSTKEQDKMLGAFSRDMLNDNGERLLVFAGDQRLAILNTFFRTPKEGASFTF